MLECRLLVGMGAKHFMFWIGGGNMQDNYRMFLVLDAGLFKSDERSSYNFDSSYPRWG